MILPIQAMHEFFINFYLSESGSIQERFNTNSGIISNRLPVIKHRLIGIQAEPLGDVMFIGNQKVFSIQFQPDGFYKWTGISPGNFTGFVTNADDILCQADLVRERLINANGLSEMKCIVEEFIIDNRNIAKPKGCRETMSHIAKLILEKKGIVNMDQLMIEANLSRRALERNFNLHVGIPPKMYARIIRFNTSIAMKLTNPENSLTDIAHYCGYFDQSHMIKDFKELAGSSPSVFIERLPRESQIQNIEDTGNSIR